MSLAAGYQGELAQNERRRISGIGDIESSGRDSELDLAIEKARADQTAGDSYLERRLEALQDIQKRREEESRSALDQAQAASQLLYTKALDKARTLAAAGDFSGYRALGYSEAEIAALERVYWQSQPR